MLKSWDDGRNAFTLVELLVVMGILAVISTAVVIVLNPAEMLKKSRDSVRQSDLATMNSAFSMFLVDRPTLSMGSSSVVYISVPDTSTTCGNLGLPSLPGGWQYHCAPLSTLTNVDGTGWLPVNLGQMSSGSSLPKLPVDPINSTSSLRFYSYVTGSGYEVTANMESLSARDLAQKDGGISTLSEVGSNLTLRPTIYPENWVFVPANSALGTQDMYVMQYEARCVSNSAPGVGLINPYDYGGYYTAAGPCTSANSKTMVSIPTGGILLDIDQATAISYCSAINAHLITNNEWQAVAWNIENTASNWSGGSVGSGSVNAGNVNQGHAVTGTDEGSGFYKRTHRLSSGDIIWDFAGNGDEYTSETITGANEPTGSTPGWNWRQFTAITNYGTLSRNQIGPVNSAWTSTQGIGTIYSDGTLSNSTSYAFVRGGNWWNGGNGGVNTINLSADPTNHFGFVTVRCVHN